MSFIVCVDDASAYILAYDLQQLSRRVELWNAACFLHRITFFQNASSLIIMSMTNFHNAYTQNGRQISWVEFAIRIFFFPQNNSTRMFHVGIFLVILGQTCRTLAMVTCGESFNHYIQRDKKDNHELVTKGM